MRMKDQIRFLNFIIGDDMDFYEEYIVHLSDDEQQEFFCENPEFMSDYAVNENRIVLMRDRVYRKILRKIKKYEEERKYGIN